MWLMYIGIVGLQSPCFADIVDSLQLDFTTSILFIFQCYLEGKDFSTIPKEITLIFSDGNITFSGETLLPHHIMSLIVFMMKSTTKWKSLDFNRCSIGCKGMHDLTKFFNNFKEKLTTVKSVNLRSNDLTSIWEMHRDNVTETALLSVESLDLSCNKFNDTGAKDLFSALHDNKKLRKLNFSLNNLTVDATTTISKCLQFNKALHELDLSDNSIADEGSQRLAEAIKENTTLRVLNISKNWISKEGVLGILKACTKNRTLHELICVYNNLSKPALASIDEYIEKEKAVKIFDASWNSIEFQRNVVVIKIVFRSSQCEIWDMNQITKSKYREEFLHGCFESKQSFNLQNIRIADCFDIDIFSDCLKKNKTLFELTLSNVMVTIEELQKVAKGIEVNTKLKYVELSYNAISDDVTTFISYCLKVNRALYELNLSGNKITDKGAERLAEAIYENTTLLVLDISNNQISEKGIHRIAQACTKNRTLHKLVCKYNNLSQTELGAIVKYIKENKAMQVFDSSFNNIISKDGEMITEPVTHIFNL